MTNIARLSGLAAVLAAMIGAAGRAEAAFVTYTETAVASGSLGSSSFSNALLTFTQTADTNDVFSNFNNTFYSVPAVTSTVSVAGLGTASFTIPTVTFNALGLIGVGQGTTGSQTILNLMGTALSNPPALYDLRSSIGPVAGPPGIFSIFNRAYATTSGDFVLNSVGTVGTFQAVVQPGAVPEPSSLTLCGLASLAGLGVWARRRKVA